jgi:hypothetical protein
MRMDLTSLLTNILTARGYDVEDTPPLEGASGASYPVTLVATRGGETRLVDALASRKLRAQDASALASIVDDVGLDGAIVLALRGVEDDATAELDDRLEVWDETESVQAAGTWLFADALDADDVDAIGPSTNVEPADTGPETPIADETDPTTEETQPASPPQSTASAQETETGATPQGPPSTNGESSTSPTPDPEPVSEPVTQADADDGDDVLDEPPQQEFLDPDEMIERAERMASGDSPSDGDAELIVEDDSSSEPESQQAQPQPNQTADEVETEPEQPEPRADPTEIEPADDGSDAEILTDDDPSSDETSNESEPEPATDPATDATRQPSEAGRGATVSPAAAAGPSEDDEAVLSGATIEPELDSDQAVGKARSHVQDVDEARLELLPFQVYDYEATVEGDGNTREVDGTLWVSTQSGSVVEAPDGDMVPEPNAPHERFNGDLGRDSTRSAANEHLQEALEFRDEVRQEYSESAVIERVTFSPREGSIELEDRGKAYAPRWRVEGASGTVFVDAVTGETVTQ